MATSDGRWRGEAKRRDGGSFLQIKIVPNAPRKGGGDSNSARSLSSNGCTPALLKNILLNFTVPERTGVPKKGGGWGSKTLSLSLYILLTQKGFIMFCTEYPQNIRVVFEQDRTHRTKRTSRPNVEKRFRTTRTRHVILKKG